MALVTFALDTITTTIELTKGVRIITLRPSQRLDQMFERMEFLEKKWREWKRQSRDGLPELSQLFMRTDAAMLEATRLSWDVKNTLQLEQAEMTVPRACIERIFSKTRKAVRAGQKITHMESFQTWKLPREPAVGEEPSEPWTEEHRIKQRQNRRAGVLMERRKQPLVCCMFISVAFARLLRESEMLEEYEQEILLPEFALSLSVDDAKTYENLRVKGHTMARLLAPPERYPRSWIENWDEELVTPCFVRNPLGVGVPVVSNMKCCYGEGETGCMVVLSPPKLYL